MVSGTLKDFPHEIQFRISLKIEKLKQKSTLTKMFLRIQCCTGFTNHELRNSERNLTKKIEK